MTGSSHPGRQKRLLVILPPSPIDAALRDVFEQAAQSLGLTFRNEALSRDLGDGAEVDILVCADAGPHAFNGETRVVVQSRSPEAAAQALAEHLAVSERDALILVSRCYGAALSVIAEGAPVFWAEDLLEKPKATLNAIFDAACISSLSIGFDDLSQRFACATRSMRRESASDVAPPLLNALTMYAGSGKAEAGAWWDRRLFRWGDYPDLECPELIDVTGAARMLAFGPFITLPSGCWRADLHFDVCDDAARRFYLVEFGAGADLSRRAFRLTGANGGGPSVEHEFKTAAPAEIRFWVARAAFHGHLGFRGVRITNCARN